MLTRPADYPIIGDGHLIIALIIAPSGAADASFTCLLTQTGGAECSDTSASGAMGSGVPEER